MSIGIGNISSQALMIDRGLYATSRAISRSLERLSTGSRLNNASDDVAGLTRATTIDAHVRGMREAVRNVNDGFGITTIAEGSLAEMTTILQQIRELAVQASSGTLSAADRENINNESRALLDEYDQIANGIEFNGIKLLNGSRSDVSLQVGDKASDTVNVGLPDARAVNIGEMGWSGYTYEETCSQSLEYPEMTSFGESADSGTLWMAQSDICTNAETYLLRSTDGGKTFTEMRHSGDFGIAAVSSFDQDIVMIVDDGGYVRRSTDGGATFSIVSAIGFSTGSHFALGTDGTGVVHNGWGSTIAYTQDYGATWTESTGTTGATLNVGKVGDVFLAVGEDGLILRSTDGGKSFESVSSDAGADDDFSGIAVARHQDAVFAYSGTKMWRSKDCGASWEELNVGVSIASVVALSSETYYIGTSDNKIYRTTNGGATYEQVARPSGDNAFVVSQMTTTDDQNMVVLGSLGNGVLAYRSTDDGYLYQENNGSDSLAGVNLSDQFKAEYALMRLDKAIESISTFRADLGSVHNVLEHRVSYLMDQEASQSGALSDLKDADYALETAELVKNQILQMAGISVLHQGLSNQSMMLDLLKG